MSQVTSIVICFLMGALRSRLSLQLEVAAFFHQLSVYQGTQRRPPISSCDRERVEWLAQGLVLCSASDGPGVATQRLPRPLAWAEWWGLPWSPIDPAGAAAPHSMHVAGQPDLGLA